MLVGATTLVVGSAIFGVRAYRKKGKGSDALPDVDDGEDEVEPVDPPEDDKDDDSEDNNTEPKGDLIWREVDPYDAGYPWPFPALQDENYPTPGTFFNVGVNDSFDPSQGFDRLVQAVLGSALAMADNDPAIAWATGQDPRAQLGRNLRRAVRKSIIVVRGFNDLLYGQTNLNWGGGNDPSKPGGDINKGHSASYILNDEGRTLNWRPVHGDNLNRIQSGQSPVRTTTLDGEKLPAPYGGNRQMLLWIPAYDLELLGPDRAVPEIGFLKWADGSSTINPPPQILELGVLSDIEL